MLRCEKCGQEYEYDDNAKFCMGCGGRLSEAPEDDNVSSPKAKMAYDAYYSQAAEQRKEAEKLIDHGFVDPALNSIRKSMEALTEGVYWQIGLEQQMPHDLADRLYELSKNGISGNHAVALREIRDAGNDASHSMGLGTAGKNQDERSTKARDMLKQLSSIAGDMQVQAAGFDAGRRSAWVRSKRALEKEERSLAKAPQSPESTSSEDGATGPRAQQNESDRCDSCGSKRCGIQLRSVHCIRQGVYDTMIGCFGGFSGFFFLGLAFVGSLVGLGFVAGPVGLIGFILWLIAFFMRIKYPKRRISVNTRVWHCNSCGKTTFMDTPPDGYKWDPTAHTF